MTETGNDMYGIAFKDKSDMASTGCKPVSPSVCLGGNVVFDNGAVAVVSDSEIYNFKKLCQLTDNGPENDAHLIALLYLRYGETVFQKIEGSFAFCIVDKKNKKVIVATDRFGIKPVVYSSNERYFVFGPDINTIQSLSMGKKDDIDYEALVDYINFSAIPTPKTIYKHIRKLPPGYFLVMGKGEVSPKLIAYYDISYTENRAGEDYFRRWLPESIELSVKTIIDYESGKGRRIGAFLSGGTDSSTVSGMIKKLTGSVKTFSIGFDEPYYNELDYARLAARHFGAEHYEYMITPEDVLGALDVVINAYDEPFGNASAVPTYFCSRLAKENDVDTLFAGDGGDEIFGGNERYAADKVFSRYRKIPPILREGLIEPLVDASPSALPLMAKGKKYIRRANIPHPDRFFSYNPVITLGKEAIFSSEVLGSIKHYDPVQWARELYNNVKDTDELNRLLYIDMKFTITDNDLRKVTTMSEKAGIKVAYPLLGYGLVDFAASIPASLKVRGTRLRYIFKSALSNFLPNATIRKKKHGFGLPIGIWIRTKNDLAAFVRETLLSSDCSIRPLFREGFIEGLFKIHRETGVSFYGDIIWLLLILELWNKKKARNSGFIKS
jgi:asparagine synthase (glutamine-hydrolysing)